MLAAGGRLLANGISTAVDLETPDAEMLVQLSRNAWQFSAAKNYRQLKDLSLALTDENGKLREWSDFREAAQKIGVKYNERWMRTEYDQAISGATSAARWKDYEKNAELMPNLQYQTVGDNFVREEHQILDGIVRPMTDAFWSTHYPPNGWGCRCEAIQIPNGLARVTPAENIPPTPVPPMFRTNLAKTGLIFPKGHPYYKGIPQSELRRAIANLPPENTYIRVAIGDREIDVHPLHGERELSKNLEAVNALLQIEPEAEIKLLPIIDVGEKTGVEDMKVRKKFFPKEFLDKFPLKNPDMLFNGKAAEIESSSGSKSSIQNAIRHGKEQADFVLVRVPDEIDFEDAKRFANGQMAHYKNKEDLTVWIYNSSEKEEYITQKRQ
jgi:SPP1 gp7 family putative phage head morphogenesis protein